MRVVVLKNFFTWSVPLFLGVFFVVIVSSNASAEGELSEEALADLVKPSVVRIAEHITGTARVPAVRVDIRQRSVEVIPDRFTEVSVDEYMTGSGFIIHPDGYIATNAHVVSPETVKTSLAGESALSAIFENALVLTDQEMDDFLNETGGENFSKNIVRYIIENSEFDLTQELVVLRPQAEEASLHTLMASGFPAEILAVNENFFNDERDVALLKINEKNLPALSLSTRDEFSVGKKVFILGFPATAELNGKNPGEATFTRGIVSAIKQSSEGDFKIFQTDAKVSQGSSGGPLFNERGEVIGMVTFQTDALTRNAGDNFAFALPIDIALRQALEARVLPEEGVYGQAFKKGFAAFLEKHCESALSSFEETKKTNSAFLPRGAVESYQRKCHEWQQEGRARDTSWDELRESVSTMSSPLLYIVGAGIFSFGILGVMMFWLLRQLRREEQEIDILEKRLRVDERELRLHEASVLKKPERLIKRPRVIKKQI